MAKKIRGSLTMKFDKTIWLAPPVVVIMWIIAAWYYPQLPETVPVHWNTHGQADNYMDKPWGALQGQAPS